MTDTFSASASAALLAQVRKAGQSRPETPAPPKTPEYDVVRSFLDGYEYRGDVDYKPSAVVRQILYDFGIGLFEHLRENAPPPKVLGYSAQSNEKIALVNENKRVEEQCLRLIDALDHGDADRRWLAIGRTHIEQAFMSINRAIMKPGRIELD